MPIPSVPSVMPNVLGYAADTVPIPEATPAGAGVPSFRDLFPFITQVDPDAGGVMVERTWMNALFNLLGQHAFFQQSGGVYPWQSTLDYIAGCHIMGSNGTEYVAQQSSGPDVPDVGPKDPVADNGTYWKASGGGERIPGEVVPFHKVTFGGPANRNPIFWKQSEPDPRWLLCDGGSDGEGGTVPDLRDRMILGAGPSHAAGTIGGSETHTHSLSGTVGATTLTVGQLAAHNHGFRISFNGATGSATYAPDGGGNTDNAVVLTNGSSQSHTHSLFGSVGAAANLSPYYALAYVIYIGC